MSPDFSIRIRRRHLYFKSVNSRSSIQLQTTVELLLTRAISPQRPLFGGQAMH